jgi:hypothetical protein
MSATGGQGVLWPTQQPRRAARPRQAPKLTTVTVSADAIAAVVAGRTTGERVIAEAIRAARPEVRNVAVDLGSIRWTDPNTRRRVALVTPAAVRAALLDLDRGTAPAPFKFAIGRMVMIRGEA